MILTKEPIYPNILKKKLTPTHFKAYTNIPATEDPNWSDQIAAYGTKEEVENNLKKEIQKHFEYMENTVQIRFRNKETKEEIYGLHINNSQSILKIEECDCCNHPSTTKENKVEAFIIINKKEYLIR